MSDAEKGITESPSQPAEDPAVEEILRRFEGRVQSVSISTVRGELRREVKIDLRDERAQ